jgi:peptidoglycan/xylan/chitin deacetylase (PgdA/CDA1 family)
MVTHRRPKPLVLCYHAVSESWPSDLAAKPTALERQLRMLLAAGHRAGTFAEVLAEGAARPTLAVTFDDGFRSVLTRAQPILERLGIPGTVFVTTDFPDRGPLRWEGISHWLAGPHEDELTPLGWEDLRRLAARGWEIGSHTRSHPYLTRLDAGGLAAELEGSRAALELELTIACRSVAYPYGDVDDAVVAAARRCGYRAGAVLGRAAAAAGPLAHPRVGVYRGDAPWRFRAKLFPTLHHVAGARRHALG